MILIEYPLIWPKATVDKIWRKHHVNVEEVEEAIFDDKPVCHKGALNSYCVYGKAVSGRYLFIVVRRTGYQSEYKAVTAREMQDKEKKYYGKH